MVIRSFRVILFGFILFVLSVLPVQTVLGELQPILVYSDTHGGGQIHQQLLVQMIGDHPAAIFHLGDMVDDGLKADQWVDFDRAFSVVFAHQIPVYPAMGNHIHHSPYYYSYFKLKKDLNYYSVDVERVHFIVLDTNIRFAKGSTQYRWLVKDLSEKRSSIDYVIVAMHHPVYSTGMHGGSPYLQRDLQPLFEKYGVRVVFSGHDHSYERSLVHSIYYIVTGGGGGWLRNKYSSSEYSQKIVKQHHYCQINVLSDRLLIRVININHQVIDEFEIKRIQ